VKGADVEETDLGLLTENSGKSQGDNVKGADVKETDLGLLTKNSGKSQGANVKGAEVEETDLGLLTENSGKSHDSFILVQKKFCKRFSHVGLWPRALGRL
jgi:hypothetical protein